MKVTNKGPRGRCSPCYWGQSCSSLRSSYEELVLSDPFLGPFKLSLGFSPTPPLPTPFSTFSFHLHSDWTHSSSLPSPLTLFPFLYLSSCHSFFASISGRTLGTSFPALFSLCTSVPAFLPITPSFCSDSCVSSPEGFFLF